MSTVGRPFKKGQSGNPSGRSKAAKEVQQAAAGYTRRSIEVLAELLDSESEKIRLEAAKEMLDRGVGKSIQTLANDDEQPFEGGLVFILPDNGRNDGDLAATIPDEAAIEPG